jgi:hypothetical protein
MEINFKTSALYALALKAQADRAEALASLNLLLHHPAGIGDHSTGDLHRNLNEALQQLTDAEDRLETLVKHFPELRNVPNQTA